jgi:hypothetical protein
MASASGRACVDLLTLQVSPAMLARFYGGSLPAALAGLILPEGMQTVLVGACRLAVKAALDLAVCLRLPLPLVFPPSRGAGAGLTLTSFGTQVQGESELPDNGELLARFQELATEWHLGTGDERVCQFRAISCLEFSMVGSTFFCRAQRRRRLVRRRGAGCPEPVLHLRERRRVGRHAELHHLTKGRWGLNPRMAPSVQALFTAIS